MRISHILWIGVTMLLVGILTALPVFGAPSWVAVGVGMLLALSIGTGFCLMVESRATPSIGYLLGCTVVASPIAVGVYFAAVAWETVALIGVIPLVLGALIMFRGMWLHDFNGHSFTAYGEIVPAFD